MSEARSWDWHYPTGRYVSECAEAGREPRRGQFCAGRVRFVTREDFGGRAMDLHECECGFSIWAESVQGSNEATLLERAGIPGRYHEAANTRLWTSELEAMMKHGLVILHGGRLDERNRLAVSRLAEWLRAGSRGRYVEAGGLRRLLMGVRSKERTAEIDATMDAMKAIGLLVVAGISSDSLIYKAVPPELIQAIKSRWNDGKPTIIVTPMRLGDLREAVGDAWDWWGPSAFDVGNMGAA